MYSDQDESDFWAEARDAARQERADIARDERQVDGNIAYALARPSVDSPDDASYPLP